MREHDVEILVRLLSEYSHKLKELVDSAVDVQNSLRTVYVFVFGGIALVCVILGLVISAYHVDTLLSWLIGGLPFAILFITPNIRGAYTLRARLQVLRGGIEVNAKKLQKLIETASEYDEYVVHSKIRRIEYDLLLTEAESTLRYAHTL